MKCAIQGYEFTVDDYFKILEEYNNGKISEEEWIYYCMAYLYELMFLHQNILKRIKEN